MPSNSYDLSKHTRCFFKKKSGFFQSITILESPVWDSKEDKDYRS